MLVKSNVQTMVVVFPIPLLVSLIAKLPTFVASMDLVFLIQEAVSQLLLELAQVVNSNVQIQQNVFQTFLIVILVNPEPQDAPLEIVWKMQWIVIPPTNVLLETLFVIPLVVVFPMLVNAMLQIVLSSVLPIRLES